MTDHERLMQKYFGTDKPKILFKNLTTIKESKDPLRMKDTSTKKYKNTYYSNNIDFDYMSASEIENFLRNNREKIELKHE